MLPSLKRTLYAVLATYLAARLQAYWAQKRREAIALKRRADPNAPTVIVIGAGFSGMCAAIKLQEAGFRYRVIEKERDFGGTWLLNTYPGCQCDVPSHDYSFSFEINPNWTTAFASSSEIYQYMVNVAKKYKLYENASFNTEVTEASYSKEEKKWTIKTRSRIDGKEQTHVANVIISGVGGLHFPSWPSAPGVNDGTFSGVEMHSAEWNSKIDLHNKRVVVVGSAASAVQIVPAIADKVKEMTVIQRTPNWLAPQRSPVLPPGLDYPPLFRFLLANVPGLSRLYRWLVYLSMEVVHWFGLFYGKGYESRQEVARSLLTRFMASQIKDRPDLKEKVIPKYPVGCKRIIRSEKFLPALARPNVHLRTDRLVAVEKEGVVLRDEASGKPYLVEADVIVYATGFKVGSCGDMKLHGTSGEIITGTVMMEKALPTYGGIVNNNFPNSFLLLGPNTGLGHQSIIVMIETQVEYVVSVLEQMAEKGVAEVRVKEAIQRDFSSRVDEALAKSVWSAGNCNSWYQNKDGKVPTLWPHSTPRYMLEMRPETDLSHYDVVYASEVAARNRSASSASTASHDKDTGAVSVASRI